MYVAHSHWTEFLNWKIVKLNVTITVKEKNRLVKSDKCSIQWAQKATGVFIVA